MVFCRVDPSVGTDMKEETSIEIAANRDSTEVLTLLAEFAELPTDIPYIKFTTTLIFEP